MLCCLVETSQWLSPGRKAEVYAVLRWWVPPGCYVVCFRVHYVESFKRQSRDSGAENKRTLPPRWRSRRLFLCFYFFYFFRAGLCTRVCVCVYCFCVAGLPKAPRSTCPGYQLANIATSSVTRGGNWRVSRCHPIFLEKIWRLCLAVVSSPLPSSNVVYPVFFLNSARKKIILGRVSLHPGGCHPGRSAPCLWSYNVWL